MRILLLVVAVSDREAKHAAQRAKIAALTDTSKPFEFSDPAFAGIEKHLKEMEADSKAHMDAIDHPQHGNMETSFLQSGAHSSLSAIQQSLKEIQARAQTQLNTLRKKHTRLPSDPDAEEDQVFKNLAAEESKTYSDMFQKLGHLSGKAAAKVKALKEGASSLIEDGVSKEAVKDATDHFSGLFGEFATLKKRADAEISKLTGRIISEPSSLAQRSEIEYRQNFEDLNSKLEELREHTKEQQRELEEDVTMKAMNAGPISLLQAAAPSSLLEDPALAERLVGDFDSAQDEFTHKMKALEKRADSKLQQLKREQDDSPFPGAPEQASLLQTSSSPALQVAFKYETPQFKAKMMKLQAETENNLKNLVSLEKVPAPSSFLQTDPQWEAEHAKLEQIIDKLKRVKQDTAAKIDQVRESAGLASSFLEAKAAREPIDTQLEAKLKKIQAETTAKIQALEAKTKKMEMGLKSSFLETGKAPKIPIVDLDKEVNSIESRSRQQLAAIMGDKDMFQGHDLESSLLEQGRLVTARKNALLDEPEKAEEDGKEAKDGKDKEKAGDEFERELEEGEKDDEEAHKPGVESKEYAEIQRQLKESMGQLRKGLSHYGEGIFGDKKKPEDGEDKKGEGADEGESKDAEKDAADKDAEEPKAESLMQQRVLSKDFLRAPRLLLQKSDEAATKAATMGLEKQFHDAFRQGFAQGLRESGAHAPTTSFIESPDPNDPPMFAELDKVQNELRGLKSDVAASFDKVSSMVNSDGSFAQMRSN